MISLNRVIDGYNGNLILINFENNAPSIKCLSKINNVLTGNAENLDIVMLMYNLIEYSKNYSETSGTLWNYTRHISTDPITNSGSFKCKTSITGKTANDRNTKEAEFSVPLKYLSNFWKTLDIPLIDCEVSLTLTWSENCVKTDKRHRMLILMLILLYLKLELQQVQYLK